MTPSLPTFSMASANRLPILRSLLALIAPDVGDLFLARDRLGQR